MEYLKNLWSIKLKLKSKNKKTYCKSQQRYPVVRPSSDMVRILDKYRDKHGFRIFIGEDERGRILIDINKVIYRYKYFDGSIKNRYCNNELLYVFHTSGEKIDSHVFDPTELPENLDILFKYKNSSCARRWILNKLNKIPVGPNGKIIGDFLYRTKHGYVIYDVIGLEKEAKKSFEKN